MASVSKISEKGASQEVSLSKSFNIKMQPEEEQKEAPFEVDTGSNEGYVPDQEPEEEK